MIKNVTDTNTPCPDGCVRFWVHRPAGAFCYDTDIPEVVECIKGDLIFTVTDIGSILMTIPRSMMILPIPMSGGVFTYQEKITGWEITGSVFVTERQLQILQSVYRRLKPFLLG